MPKGKKTTAVERIRLAVIDYLEKDNFKETTGGDATMLSYRRKPEETFYYTVTADDVTMMATHGQAPSTPIGSLVFKTWAKEGYTTGDVERILAEFPWTEDMKVRDDSAQSPENIAQIEEHNAATIVRDNGAGSKYAFTLGDFYESVCELCDMAEQHIKQIPKGEQIANKLNQVRLTLMSHLDQPADPKQSALPLDETDGD